MPDKVRIDKWLWSVRIFKTRTLATTAVRSGKVKVNEKIVKASYLLQAGETVVVGKNGFNFVFKVIELIQKRVGAAVAQTCYVDRTSPDELNKYNDWFIGKRGVEAREKGAGRPTKKERREIDGFKGGQLYDWDDWDEE
ncbi:MAG: RNA-binding protein [Bacteroidetes bacterium]|nr:MAG: RNA-binding protein [Bacteroidota bacterium]PTM11372.1 MAG: RNA-binding protein [Bacteroidota bacterium]